MERLLVPFTTEKGPGRENPDHESNSFREPDGMSGTRTPMILENSPGVLRLPSPDDQNSSGGSSVKELVRIAIKVDGKILFFDTADVIAVKAEGNWVSVQHKTRTYLVRETMATVEDKLRPHGFVRIHRTILVNAALVSELKRTSSRKYSVSVLGGWEYPVGLTHRDNLRAIAMSWLGVEI
jgi:DNA-binding LytR/AlgR family response regulator